MTSKRRTKMSGNYKPRDKTEDEEIHDIEKLNEATLKCADGLSEFFTEFVELDGDVFFSSYNKAGFAASNYEREKHISKMNKVGKEWDWEKGIIGDYRYNDI
tara:strand:- start:622 stop:927 length:306 start_codon:yes stop_codon:yes gene_type:complete